MSNIVIDKWYGKEKTDLINKNTIDKVEFIEQNTDVVGGEVYKKDLWLWENITEQDFLDAGFSTITMTSNTGTNTNCAWADEIRTNTYEMLGNATIKFKNIYGDMSKANYSVTVKCIYRKNGATNFYTFEFLKGSMVTPNTQESTAIAGNVDIAFSGDMIILSLTNMLLYGDYYLTSLVFPEASSQRNLRPWVYYITVVYGGLETTEEKKEYGSGESSFSFDKNTLIEAHTTIDGEKLSESIASNILTAYKDGKQTVSLNILCDKFKDTNGNIVIDINSANENIKHLVEIGDTFYLRKRGIDLYVNPDGTAKQFMVTKANLSYKGKPKMYIEGVEV